MIPQKNIASSKNKITIYTNFSSLNVSYICNSSKSKIGVLTQVAVNHIIYSSIYNYIKLFSWIRQLIKLTIATENEIYFCQISIMSINESNTYRHLYASVYQNKAFIDYSENSFIILNSIFMKQKSTFFTVGKNHSFFKRYPTVIAKTEINNDKATSKFAIKKKWWYNAVKSIIAFFKSAKGSNITIPFSYNFGFVVKNIKPNKKKLVIYKNAKINEGHIKAKQLFWLKKKRRKFKIYKQFYKKSYKHQYIYRNNLINRKLFQQKWNWKSIYIAQFIKSSSNYKLNKGYKNYKQYLINKTFIKSKQNLKKAFVFFYQQKQKLNTKNLFYIPKYRYILLNWFKGKINKEKSIFKEKQKFTNFITTKINFTHNKTNNSKQILDSIGLNKSTCPKIYYKPEQKKTFYYKALTFAEKKEELVNFTKIKNILCLLTNARFSMYYINAISVTRFAFDDHVKKSSIKYRSFVLNNSIRPRSFIINNLVKVKTSKVYLNKLTRNRERRFIYVAIFIKDIVRITFFCIFLKKANFMANFYAFAFSKLPRKRKETVFIRFLIKRLKSAATGRKEIIGIRFRFQGRVNRWRRTKFIIGQKGIWLFYSISSFIEFGQSQAVTRKGSQSIRIWLCYKSSFTPVLRKTIVDYIELSLKNTIVNLLFYKIKKLIFKKWFNQFHAISEKTIVLVFVIHMKIKVVIYVLVNTEFKLQRKVT